MDERRNTIKELEEKKRTLAETRNNLFRQLGETLLQRIGDGEYFTKEADDRAGVILTEYRKHLSEISESVEIIKTLEIDGQRFKTLDDEIALKETEKFQVTGELEEIFVRLGKAMLANPDFEELAEPFSAQEEGLLAKIEEQERKLEDLEEREGGIFAWLGKNAQMAVSKTLLSKYRSNLKRLHHSAGEKLLSSGQCETLDGEAAETAHRLNGSLSSLTADLSILKGERRKIAESFGSDGTPTRRIQRLEKHITHVKGEFPDIHLRLGSLTDEEGGKEQFSSLLKKEDNSIFENADQIKSQIADVDVEIGKVKAAINIDREKAEIEKIKKSIQNQRQKIITAESAISEHEKQINECVDRISELELQLKA
ncbi:MAG: hypothetical protein FWG77_00100 [Treponema sp.]|nr:hypothetical protein [Treponema sp.]